MAEDESEDYRVGRQAFRPGSPKPQCPYPEYGEREDWERGWGDAHGHQEMHGDE
jgi:ribosome modulation factor